MDEKYYCAGCGENEIADPEGDEFCRNCHENSGDVAMERIQAARALSAAVDAFVNAPNGAKAKEWRRLMGELRTANERFKEAGR